MTIANYEAILNTLANTGELFGIIAGLGFLIGAFIALLGKRWSTAGKWAVISILAISFGLALPAILNLFINGNHCLG